MWVKDGFKELRLWMLCLLGGFFILCGINWRLALATGAAIFESGPSIYLWVMFVKLSIVRATVVSGLIGVAVGIFVWYRLERLWRLNAKQPQEGRHWTHIFFYPGIVLLSMIPFCTILGFIAGFSCRLNKWAILAVVLTGSALRHVGTGKVFSVLNPKARLILCIALFATGAIIELVRRKRLAASLPSTPSIEIEIGAVD